MEQALKPRLPQTYRDAIAELLETLDREEELKTQLDTSKDWYSIKRVAALNGVDWKTFNWRKLKETGLEMGYDVKKIFDANYGEVNTYHKDVWEAVYPIDSSTVCQCTGMTDKNGKLIWENDIIKYHFGNVYAPIKFGTYQSCFDSQKTAHQGFYVDWALCQNMRKDLGYWVNMVDSEICGNILDNPELLEE